MLAPTFAAVACTSDDDDDRVLVQRYLGGDPTAFTSLVVRYQGPIYNAAFWILRRHEDAHDVSQTVFLKVAERADEYDPRYKFFSWIYRIAVNESLNVQRRNRHEDELDEGVEVAGDESAGPERQASAAELARQLRQVLMSMTTNDRLVLTLRHFSECSYEEMARILDLDEKTVKSRLFEARRRLRDLLKDWK
ncbi:MAG TPA: sigma-70 family RNA polymerase sigma factor [Caldimonas sp.]|nr:sigma-70 family RNA polymerase sigma factor [Caldimonas sp.]